MRQYNLSPEAGDVEELDDMFELNRETGEYDEWFHDYTDTGIGE